MKIYVDFGNKKVEKELIQKNGMFAYFMHDGEKITVAKDFSLWRAENGLVFCEKIPYKSLRIEVSEK